MHSILCQDLGLKSLDGTRMYVISIFIENLNRRGGG